MSIHVCVYVYLVCMYTCVHTHAYVCMWLLAIDYVWILIGISMHINCHAYAYVHTRLHALIALIHAWSHQYVWCDVMCVLLLGYKKFEHG